MMSHLNGLELNNFSENATHEHDDEQAQTEDNSEINATDDGWTIVTKGGRKKR